MEREDIEYIQIPKRLLRSVGEPDPGTRLYRQVGREAEQEAWWNAVSEVCAGQGAVSPGGASMFGPMSRAGVYKRIKEGRLTAFIFHWAPKGKRWRILDLFGKDSPPEIMYLAVAELRSWAERLRNRKRIEPEGPMDDAFLRLKRKQLQEYVKKRKTKG